MNGSYQELVSFILIRNKQLIYKFICLIYFIILKGKILGDVSQYNVACTCFSQAILEKSDLQEHKNIVTEEDMKKYFAKFSRIESAAVIGSNQKSSSIDQSYLAGKFMAKKIYKGYIDDPRNTDNAWFRFLILFI